MQSKQSTHSTQTAQQGTGRTAAQAVMDRLGEIELGEGITHGRMSVFPVFAPGHAENAAGTTTPAAPLAYRTLQEALADGTVKVTEREQASVPELIIENSGSVMILILDGEEIVGGRQNRIVNASFLVPANTTMPLPVSCVEHGRWHDTSPVFASGEAGYFSLRQAKHSQVTHNLRAMGRHISDQGAIWDSVAHTAAAAQVASPSGAMHDIYRSRDRDLTGYQAAFAYVPGALGMVVALGGQPAGCDFFDQPHTAEQVWPKLVRSYALDALDAPENAAGGAVDREQARDLLARARVGRYEVFPSAVLGEDVRLEGDQVVGGGLVHEDVPIHITVFRADDPQTGSRQAHIPVGRMVRASQRREMTQLRRDPASPDPAE